MKQVTLFLLTVWLLLFVNGCASLSDSKISEKSAFPSGSRTFNGIQVDDFTRAPLRAIKQAHFKASPNAVFSKISHHAKLYEWVPMLDHDIKVDHSQAENPGTSGVGTRRICVFDGDTLVERIMAWRPNQGYAYSVVEGSDLAIDHLGVMTVESDGEGGTIMTWRQYFNPAPGSIKAKMMPYMINHVMNGALENLSSEFGGVIL